MDDVWTRFNRKVSTAKTETTKRSTSQNSQTKKSKKKTAKILILVDKIVHNVVVVFFTKN